MYHAVMSAVFFTEKNAIEHWNRVAVPPYTERLQSGYKRKDVDRCAFAAQLHGRKSTYILTRQKVEDLKRNNLTALFVNHRQELSVWSPDKTEELRLSTIDNGYTFFLDRIGHAHYKLYEDITSAKIIVKRDPSDYVWSVEI